MVYGAIVGTRHDSSNYNLGNVWVPCSSSSGSVGSFEDNRAYPQISR